MDFKIEKKIPLPEGKCGFAFAEACRKMNVGDSFVYAGTSFQGMYASAKRHGIKIAMRTMPDNTRRVWRIA